MAGYIRVENSLLDVQKELRYGSGNELKNGRLVTATTSEMAIFELKIAVFM
jgi:hypothetical protein